MSTSKKDPIRSTYFKSLEHAENASSWLSYIGCAISLAMAFVDEPAWPKLFSASSISLIVLALLLLILNLSARLYLSPRADGARRMDFISKAFSVGLTTERTHGYYNNQEGKTYRRLGAMLLENLHFTKSILAKMAIGARVKAVVALVILLLAFSLRGCSYGVITTIAQLVLGGEVISHCIRLEWYRINSENLYDKVYQLFSINSCGERFAAHVIGAFANYETSKAFAGILLCSKTFQENNDLLSHEWELIKKELNIT